MSEPEDCRALGLHMGPGAGMTSHPAVQMWTKEGQVIPTVIGAMAGYLKGRLTLSFV